MNWTKWSSITEIASTLAIAGTLIYLVIQTQQNSNAINSAARQALMLADVGLLLERSSDPERLLLWCSNEVTPEEDIKRSSEMLAIYRIREIAWLQYRSGVLDEATWQSYAVILSTAQFSDPARAWWEATSEIYDREFVEYVNTYVRENPSIYAPCSEYFSN